MEILGAPDRWARLLGWATLAGIIAALIGPFGSFYANIFYRLTFWTGLFWAGAVMIWPGLALAIGWGKRHRLPAQLCGAIAVVAACVPLSFLAASGGHLFWPLHASGMRALEWYLQTLLVAAPATAILYWLEGRPASRDLALVDTPEEPQPHAGDVAERTGPTVPDYLLETALCLQMEDHHIRIHGAQRSTLHLGSMQEVTRGLDPARGLRVHRSWWVARHAIRTVETNGRSVALLLDNGVRVPVARNRIALLREQGWLDEEPRLHA